MLLVLVVLVVLVLVLVLAALLLVLVLVLLLLLLVAIVRRLDARLLRVCVCYTSVSAPRLFGDRVCLGRKKNPVSFGTGGLLFFCPTCPVAVSSSFRKLVD